MSRRMHSLSHRGRTLVILLIAALAASGAALAFWSTTGKGSATAHVSILPAPAITSAVGGGESATLSWSSVTPPGSGAVKYYVSRDGEAPSGTCATSASPTTATSCTDTGVSPGSHSYTVTAVWRSWTATSAAKSVTTISAPIVTAANPSSRGQGGGAQTIVITGSHFASGASTTISGTGVTVNSTTFKSSTELTVAITVTAGASTGARNVTVTNPDSGSATGTGIFTVNAAPTVTSTSPSSRGQGATNQTVTIKGSGFASGATSSFGSGITVNSTTFKSSTELTANISIEAGASTGARTVTVTNPDAGVGSLAAAFTVSAAPTVTSTSPSSRGQGATSQTITVKGSGFVSGTGLAVSFSGAGITVNSTTFKTSTEVTANITIEAGASTGARAVSVSNPDGGTGSLANGFTVNAAPNVESTNPSSRPQGASKQTVAIKGSGFASGASSSFGSGITVESTSFVNSTELSAKISVESGASAGARTVTVTNTDGGVGSLAGGFTVNALPNVESTSPNSGNRGGSETVVIKGTGFASGASSSFSSNVTVESTTFVSSTELKAKISIDSFASTGSRTVTVTNPDGGSDSQSGAFTVNSAPTVTSTSPSSRGQGATSQTVAVKGTNFEGGAGLAVSFSGTGITVNSTSFVSTTEVSANITVATNATTGPRNVTVTNPDTTSATGNSAFAVNALPTVTSTSPSSRGQGATSQTITVKGSGFVSGTGLAVSFSGAGITVNSTTFKSSTEVTANITIEAEATVGARAVTVTNPDGGTGSLASGFTVNAAPSVESTNPSSRGQGATGQTVVIKGSGFVNGATSSFGAGIIVNSTTFKSSTEVTANITIEAGASTGARTVSVTNPDAGVASLASGFSVSAGPNVEAASPNTGNKGGTETVIIKGTGFAAGATSSFGSGTTVASTSFVSSTELSAKITIESGASTGARNVTVTNTDAGSDSQSNAFTVNGAPTVTSTSPSSRGQGATSQTIVVKGTNFESGTGLGVSFSGTGITVNSTSFISTTEVSANVTIASNATTGPRTLTVTNPDTTSAAGSFTVNAAPTVTSTSPSSRGQGATSQTVAIKGSGFVSGASSSFGAGIIVNTTTFKSSTEVTANITIEAGASTGARTVTVTNSDAGVGSLASGFAVNVGPSVASTSPNSRGQGASKQTIAIKGSGFVSGATSSFGSGVTVESTSFVSLTELSAKISVESGASTGARTVTVTNPDGGLSSLASAFTVNTGPTITSPNSSPPKRAKIMHGTTGEFTVLGSGFVSGMTVSISGGFTVNLTTFVSSGELKVKVTAAGNGNQGKYDLTVTNPDGGSDTSENSIENT